MELSKINDLADCIDQLCDTKDQEPKVVLVNGVLQLQFYHSTDWFFFLLEEDDKDLDDPTSLVHQFLEHYICLLIA